MTVTLKRMLALVLIVGVTLFGSFRSYNSDPAHRIVGTTYTSIFQVFYPNAFYQQGRLERNVIKIFYLHPSCPESISFFLKDSPRVLLLDSASYTMYDSDSTKIETLHARSDLNIKIRIITPINFKEADEIIIQDGMNIVEFFMLHENSL